MIFVFSILVFCYYIFYVVYIFYECVNCMFVKLYFKYLSNSYVLFVCCDVYGDNDEQSLVLRSLLSCVQMEGHALSHGTNSDCLSVSLSLYRCLLAHKFDFGHMYSILRSWSFLCVFAFIGLPHNDWFSKNLIFMILLWFSRCSIFILILISDFSSIYFSSI